MDCVWAINGEQWVKKEGRKLIHIQESRQINATDSHFFWLSLYVVPVLWVLLAIVAIIRWEFIWLSLVGTFPISLFLPPIYLTNILKKSVIAVILCATNGIAFSRADKFGNASSFAGRALGSSGGGFAKQFVGNMTNRMFFSGR